jgi:hypothetical protein
MPSAMYAQTTYKTLGELVMSLIPGLNGITEIATNGDDLQRNDVLYKTHILDISASSMDPQREWMFMLYIRDIKGRYWTEVGLNYASFGQRLVNYGYAISFGTISTAIYKGLIDLFKTGGKTGSTSAQQELIYRTNSVTLPSREFEGVTSNFMGVKNNLPINTVYTGDLAVTFEEGEDAFILRQFNSWMNVIDEWVVQSADKSTNNNLTGVTGKLQDLVGEGGSLATNSSLSHQVKTDIELMMFRYSGEDIGYKIKFFGCYPKSIGNSSWSYTGGGTITYSVSFAYDYFKIQYIKSPLKPAVNKFKSVVAELIDGVLQTVMNELFLLILRSAAKKTTRDRMKSSQYKPAEIIQKTLNKAEIAQVQTLDSVLESMIKKVKSKVTDKNMQSPTINSVKINEDVTVPENIMIDQSIINTDIVASMNSLIKKVNIKQTKFENRDAAELAVATSDVNTNIRLPKDIVIDQSVINDPQSIDESIMIPQGKI